MTLRRDLHHLKRPHSHLRDGIKRAWKARITPKHSKKAAYEAFEGLPAPQQPPLRLRQLLYHEKDDNITYKRHGFTQPLRHTTKCLWLANQTIR